MRKYYFVIWIICCGMYSAAQESKYVDSLKLSLLNETNDTSYVRTLNKLSKAYRYSNQIMAMDYAIKAEKLAQEISYNPGLALAYHNISSVYIQKQNNELALDYINKSLAINLVLKNKKGMADCYGNLGLIYRRKRAFSKAVDYHERSLRLKRELHDSVGIAYSYGNLGIIYMEQGQYDKALQHFYNSLRLKESLKDKYGIANSHGNIGIIYLQTGSLENARKSLEQSLDLFMKINNSSGVAGALLYLSDVYFQDGNIDKARDAVMQCIDINKEQGNVGEMAEAFLKLGKILQTKGNNYQAELKYKSALANFEMVENVEGIVSSQLQLGEFYAENNRIGEARLMLEKVLSAAKKEGFTESAYKASVLLGNIYKTLGWFKQSATMFSFAQELSDTLTKKNLTKELAQLEMQYEFDKQMQQKEFEKRQLAQQNLLNAQQNKRERLFYLALLSVFVVFILFMFRYQILMRKKSKLLEKQRVHIKEQLLVFSEQKKELERSNSTKSRVLSVIGHDLRTPFNAINGVTAYIIENYNTMSSEEVAGYLQSVKQAGERAHELLENLLYWAMNQNDDLVLHEESVSLNAILKGNIRLVGQLADQKNITIEPVFEANPMVKMDKNMINTVLRNLLSNAIKFTPENGEIRVESSIEEGLVKVLVEDNGIGMSQELLRGLFEPGKIKPGAGGVASSGLGIVLCRDFLAQHQQELHVESVEGKGSKFWFYLENIQA